MIQPILDISRWQGNIDADVMLASDAWGLMIRMGSIDYNGPYEDYLFRENHAKFDHELPCGYYWFFKPEYSGVRQAEYVVGLLKELQIRLILPMAPDVESNYNNVSKAEYWYELSEFIRVLIANGYLKLADYTRGIFWNDNLGNPPNANKQLLWIARYNSYITHPWEDCCKPLSWDDYWMWQYSADGNGLGEKYGCDCDSVDMNRVNMTEEEWKIFTEQDVPSVSWKCLLRDFLAQLGDFLGKDC